MYRWSVYYTLYGKKCKGGRTQLEYMRRAWLLPWENLRRWSSRSEYYHNHQNIIMIRRMMRRMMKMITIIITSISIIGKVSSLMNWQLMRRPRNAWSPGRLPSSPFTTTFYLVTPLWPNFQPFLLFQPINFLFSDTTVDHCQTFKLQIFNSWTLKCPPCS